MTPELEAVREIRSKAAAALANIDERIADLEQAGDEGQPFDMEAEGYIFPRATIVLLHSLEELGEWAGDQRQDMEYNPLPHAETIAGELPN